MKKLLICLLLLPSLAWGQDYARMNPYILGGGVSAAGGTCSTYNLEQSGVTEDGSLNFCAVSDGRSKVGTSFVASGNYTIQQVSVKLNKVGSGAGSDLIVSICDDNGSGLPSSTCTQIGTVDNTASSGAFQNVTQATIGSGKSVNNGAKYHLIVDCNGHANGTNYAVWVADTSESGVNISQYDGSWSETYGDKQLNYRTYSCTP